jgi:guanylate kinase
MHHDLGSDLLLLIVCSPSGAGKTTLTRELLRTFNWLTFSVSCTTRKPRAAEVDGRDYFFIDRAEFERRVADGKFIEWAEVHGNLYGTSIAELARARSEGKMGVVFDVDYQGARQIKAQLQNVLGVFILPPSMEELARRLRGRATDDEATIQRRFEKAKREIENYRLFDYIIVNDDLEKSQARLRSIVYAETSRSSRMAISAERLLRDETVGSWPFQTV